MSIIFVPAAAGAAITTFAAEPAFHFTRQAARKYLAPKSPTTSDVVVSMLNGASIGLGATTLAACFATSISIWPHAAIGAAAGAVVVAAWHVLKAAGRKVAIRTAMRNPELASRVYVRYVQAQVRAESSHLVRTARKIAGLFTGIGFEAGRLMAYRPTVAAVLPTQSNVAAIAASGFAAAEMTDPTPTGALLIGSLGMADYLRRTGQTLAFKGVTLFSPRQIQIAAGAFLGLGVASVLKDAWRSLKSRRAESKARDEAGLINAMANAVAQTNAATVSVDLPVEFLKAVDTVMSRVVDENIEHFTNTAEHLMEQAVLKDKAELTDEQKSRIEAAASTASATPVIVPIQDAEVKPAAKATMSKDQAKQVVEDARALANGQPLPQKPRQTSAKKRPGKPAVHNNARATA